jgi:hypothetical protein
VRHGQADIEHQQRPTRALLGQPNVAAVADRHALGGIADRGIALGNAPAQRRGDVQGHALQQLVLGAEVIVKRRRRHLGSRRDLLHGRGGAAAHGQHADRRGDEQALRALALGQPARRRLGQHRRQVANFGLTVHF